MDTILLIILIILLGATLGILYLNLKSKPKDENENKEAEELANLNAEIVRLKIALIRQSIHRLVQCLLHLILYQPGLQRI